MRCARLPFLSLTIIPLFGISAQSGPLKRTLIDSFVTSSRVGATMPVFNRQRIYYVLGPDTLVLYDIATKRSHQIGTGQWAHPSVSRNGDILVFTRAAEGSRIGYVWTLPLDPATGRPTGPARRASMSPAYWPALSPDGKWIAFAADSDHRRLTMIPVNGGRERDLVHGPGDFWSPEWSSDGTQIYFGTTIGDKPSHDEVKRIAASGGTPVTISDKNVSLDAISPDGSRIVVDEDSWPWRTFVLDPSGRALVPNAFELEYSYAYGSLLSPTQALDATPRQPNLLKSLTLVGGAPPETAFLSEDVSHVSWSPDGTRYAAIGHTQKLSELLIASRDGATRARASLPAGLGSSSFAWSPDGRSIAMIGSADLSATLMVVDAATGKTQVAPTSGITLGAPHWMNDSKHIRYFSGSVIDSGDVRAVRETSVGGPDRLLRELSNRFQVRSVFASDTTVLAWSDSGTTLVSLTSGMPKVLYTVDGGAPTVSPHGDLIVMRPPQRDATGGARRTAEVISPTGAHVATVTFPGIIGFGVLDHFLFTPDQRSIIGTGRDEAGHCCVVYQGFLDGSPTQRLGEVSNASPRGLALSPDGKTLLYTVAGPWLVTFQSIDLPGTARGMPRD